MQNQPIQIDRKEFKELLKEIQKYNMIDLIAQGFQTKYAKEAVGIDDEQRRKDAAKTNELLEGILLALSGTKDKSSAKVASIGVARRAKEKDDENKPRTFQDVKNLVREDLSKFKEEIKTGVALTKKVGGGIADFGKSAFGQAKDILSTSSDYKNPMIASLQRPSIAKVDNPNIVDSPTEKVAEENQKQSASIKELLDVTKESLNQQKAIRSSLEGTPATRSAQPTSKTPKTAPVAAAPAAAEGGGSVVGDIAGAAASGIGGKVLGGLKAGGAILGKGALAAGKFIGGAALAKPALIAAGVGLAAYGAYKGYKALTKKDDGAAPGAASGTAPDPFIEKAKNSKQAQEIIKLNEQGKYNFTPEGSMVNVFDKESNELVRSIKAPEFIKGAELLQALGIGSGAAGAQKPKGEVKGKDGAGREMSVEELKAQRQKIADRGPRTKTVQSQETHQEQLRTMDMAIADKERKQAAVDPSGMGDNSEYKRVDTGSLRQGQQGLKAQHEQFVKDTKPGSGYKEEPAAPKKTIGQRIASFFGFGKEETPKEDDLSKLKNKALNEAVKAVQEQIKKDPETRSSILLDKAMEVTEKYSTLQGGKLAVQTSQTLADKAVAIAQGKDQGPVAKTPEEKEKEEAARSGKLGLKAQHEQFTKDTKPGSGYGNEAKEDTGIVTKGQKVRDEATKLGLDPNKAQGSFEGGVLTGITDESGKTYKVNVSEKDKNKVEAARTLRAANERSSSMAQQIPATSTENAAIKDQMAASGKSTTPVVMNNVSNNSQTTYVPIKGEPRPGSRGSALDRYNDRIATFY